jgi:hypothetical protein
VSRKPHDIFAWVVFQSFMLSDLCIFFGLFRYFMALMLNWMGVAI